MSSDLRDAARIQNDDLVGSPRGREPVSNDQRGAAGGKGVAGEQFAGFAKWYADTKAAGRGFGDIKPTVEDYGDAKSGDAVTAEVSLQSLQGDTASSQCMMFAWIEGSPRKETQTFSCDDVAGIEKWKTGQSLKSAWR